MSRTVASGAQADPAAAKRRGPKWTRRRGLTVLLLVADILVFLVMVVLLDDTTFSALVFGVILLAGLWKNDPYRTRLTLSILDDLPVMAKRFLIAAAFTALLFEATSDPQFQAISVVKWSIIFAVLVLVRAVLYAVVRRLRANRLMGKTTVIVGCGKVGVAITNALQRERECGLEPIGFVDSPPPGLVGELPLPMLGSLEDLPDVIERHHVEMVIVAYTYVSEHTLVPIIRTADRLPAHFVVVPRLFELLPVRNGMDHISDMPLVPLARPAFRSPLWPLKRISDVLVAAIAVVLLSPLLVGIAIVNRIVDGPGVIFRQERIGVDGKLFQLLKFRSLRPATETESATMWNIKHDDRVSWFGKLLRKSSLDELPQLLNVLRGQMSIVGPRPERPHFSKQFSEVYPYYGSRHRVPSGLTGWAQVHGLRGDTSIAGRARYDNFYNENWSIWLDVKIILRTFSSLAKGSG